MSIALSIAPQPQLLIIDDSPHELRELISLLRRFFWVHLAFDGRSGLARARALQPALILLDLVMPDIDGFAVCRLLKADPLTLSASVIFVSAYADAEQRVRGFSNGAVDFINKPFHPDEVLARVHVQVRAVAGTHDALAEAEGTIAQVAQPRVRAAVRHICKHIAQPLTVSDVAQAVGCSERQLTVLFKQHLGTTVSGFVAEQRMKIARRLLAETELPVQDVAFEAGFSNPANFSTSFRLRNKLTPQAFRLAVRR